MASQASSYAVTLHLFMKTLTSALEVSFMLRFNVGSSEAVENIGPSKPNR